MEQKTKLYFYKVEGMTCGGCEAKIENALKALEGVVDVRADRCGGIVRIQCLDGSAAASVLRRQIESAGYRAVEIERESAQCPAGLNGKTLKSQDVPRKHASQSPLKMILLALAVLTVLWQLQTNAGLSFVPEMSPGMSYGLLFFIGLMTSVHCIAMCGGIALSQCVQPQIQNAGGAQSAQRDMIERSAAPSFLYNAGRVVSYTLIGGAAGALGTVIGFNDQMRGAVTFLAGGFMILMGLNLLGAAAWAGRLISKVSVLQGSRRIRQKKFQNPFVVGLMNGFMPCGPLQTMQIYALGTGSFVAGALSMLAFSLGTTILMFGFGLAGTLFSRAASNKMFKFSAVLVLVLGVVMMSRGLSLAGVSLRPAISVAEIETLQDYGQIAVMANGNQTVTIDLHPGYYEPIIVQKGIPVKFNIRAAANALNGCNDAVQIPEFEIQKPLIPGDNWIEFTPDQTGVIPYSCWMGMIRSEILVVEALPQVR